MHQDAADLNHSTQLHVDVMKAVVAGDVAKAGDASDALLDYLEQFTRKTLDLY